MSILEVQHISKTYGKGETKVNALNDVSFSVEQGEFVAIIGPSGSGKSTLLHILGGVDTPSSGNVIINGVNIATLNETALAIFRRRQIGLIYQFYNLIPILTVEENLTLPLLLDGRKPDRRQIEELINTLVDTNFNTARASEALYMHKNTFLYQYNKIRDVLNVNPQSSYEDKWFLIFLQLFLKKK